SSFSSVLRCPFYLWACAVFLVTICCIFRLTKTDTAAFATKYPCKRYDSANFTDSFITHET
ncbi:MAG: hypothetical protein ACOYJB_07840, partial [Christensenellaceae bacterium]